MYWTFYLDNLLAVLIHSALMSHKFTGDSHSFTQTVCSISRVASIAHTVITSSSVDTLSVNITIIFCCFTHTYICRRSKHSASGVTDSVFLHSHIGTYPYKTTFHSQYSQLCKYSYNCLQCRHSQNLEHMMQYQFHIHRHLQKRGSEQCYCNESIFQSKLMQRNLPAHICPSNAKPSMQKQR